MMLSKPSSKLMPESSNDFAISLRSGRAMHTSSTFSRGAVERADYIGLAPESDMHQRDVQILIPHSERNFSARLAGLKSRALE